MSLFEITKNFTIKVLKCVPIVILAFSALVFYNQNKLLYLNYIFNVPMLTHKPHHFGVSWRNIYLKAEDGEILHGWLLHSGNNTNDGSTSTSENGPLTSQSATFDSQPNTSNKPIPSEPFTISSLTNKKYNTVFIYLHENAGDLSGRIRNLVEIQKYVYNVDATLIVDYRGYGYSTGSPSEKGLKIDARSILKFTKETLKADKIIVFGRSLGGAVALSLQDHEDLINYIDLMIIENTFTQISDMIHHIFPKWLKWISIFSWNKWRSIDRIPHVKCPLLLISGEKDEIVPNHMMKKLFKLATSPSKCILDFKNGTHNDTFIEPDYYTRLNAYLKQYLKNENEL